MDRFEGDGATLAPVVAFRASTPALARRSTIPDIIPCSYRAWNPAGMS